MHEDTAIIEAAVIDSASSWHKRLLIGIAAALATLLLSWVDRHVHHTVPLVLIYLFPMALLSTVTRRWEVPIAAAMFMVVAEYSDAFRWNPTQGVARDALYFIAYAAEGLYITEMLSKRRAQRIHVNVLTQEIAARREAEEQLQLLIDCSSAAILTADQSGVIVQANAAAIRLFTPDGRPPEQLEGPLGALLPALSRVPMVANEPKSLRTMLQCQGFRSNREPFVADVWFSTYRTPKGARMTAVVADVSDDFRSREESSLEQVLHGSRLVIGAMAHEMRNVCGAIELVCGHLDARNPSLNASQDLKALRQLSGTLERMTTVELSHLKRSATPIRLQQVIDDVRIIFANATEEPPLEIVWGDAKDVPPVWADHQGLLQVFLNLLRNAQSALGSTASPRIEITAECKANTVEVHITDNGPGISDPGHLFRRFQEGARVQGLGLYLSRAMVMSFRGDLRYEAAQPGARFIVELLIAK
jgi:two-component system, LuxR family, sensor kinase FixL